MSDDTVTLWALPPSANSAVIRSFLNVTSIPYKEENAWGKTRTDEYIQKYPTNLAPAVTAKGVHVSECAAILRHLARAYGDDNEKVAPMYPVKDLEKCATIDWLCDFINTGICAMIPKATYPALQFPLSAGDVGDLEETKEHTSVAVQAAGKACLEILKGKYVDIFLKDTKFLLSDTPTIADFRFAPMLNFLKIACVVPEEIKKYEAAMMELPGYKEGCQGAIDYASKHWKPENK